jgi:F-type H+-transporting ATPase subunit gamma
MYAIAATQLTKEERALLSARPFGEEGVGELAKLWALARQEGLTHPLLSGVESQDTALLVVNSDRGLCGRYVGEVNRAAERFAHGRDGVRLLVGGDKAYRYFRRRPWPIVREYRHVYEPPSLEVARGIQSDLLELYGREVGEVYVVYMEFRGELTQRLKVERLLPLDLPEGEPQEMILEPKLPGLLDQATRLFLLGRIFLILLLGKTSEHAIRRQAMKAATDNADDLLEKLTLRYNKARQHGITAELADIMGGAEALRSAE